MRPELFSVGGLSVSSYALMISVAATLGFWLTLREARRKGVDEGATLGLAVVAFAAALIGARSASLLLHGDVGERGWSSFLLVWERGGMSLAGGFVLATAAGLAWIRALRLRAWDAADTLALAWTPALALVRVGCFLNGCCFGRPTDGPFGIVAGGAPANVAFDVPSYPTQLFAAAFAAALFALLMRLRERRRFEGQLALTFVGLLAAFRFANGFLRGDTRVAWRFGDSFSLGLNQLLALAAFAFVALAWRRLARKPARP
jgi:phosphatidylglycerol:prolipoprotein diacylglycerol transferase